MAVHFPIAFYALELLLISLWIRKHNEEYKRFARFAFWLGYFLMLAALATGYLDAGGWQKITGAVRRHFFSAMTVLTIYSLRACYWRWGSENGPHHQRIQWLGALVSYSAVVVTAFFGGLLVHS